MDRFECVTERVGHDWNSYEQGVMEPDPDGRWVEFSDVERLESELTKATSSLDIVAKQRNAAISELTKEREGLDALRGELERVRKSLEVITEAPYDAAGLREIARLTLTNEKLRADALAALTASQETTHNTEEDR